MSDAGLIIIHCYGLFDNQMLLILGAHTSEDLYKLVITYASDVIGPL